MKPGDAAKLLGIGRSTVSAWTSGEYRDYLSPSAQGGNNTVRSLSDNDVRILHFIDSLKKQSTPPEEIHVALHQLQRDGWQDLPPMPNAPAGMAVVPVMPTAAADVAVATIRHENVELQRRINELEDRLDALRQEAKNDLDSLHRESAVEREKLLRELGSVQNTLARTETLLELYKTGKLKPDEQE